MTPRCPRCQAPTNVLRQFGMCARCYRASQGHAPRPRGTRSRRRAGWNTVPGTIPPAAVQQSANDLFVQALAMLEDALVARMAERGGVTKDMEAQFATYQKVKAHALQNANDNERRNALRLALQQTIRMVV